MLNEEELSFPKELRDKARKSHNMWGWRFDDIPSVVENCRRLGFAILGGQTEFFLPDGTCELYWLKADPKPRSVGEAWETYVERSCTEFSQLFTLLVKKTDFEKEGLESFGFLKNKKPAGINILDYLCFEVAMVSETGYNKLHSTASKS